MGHQAISREPPIMRDLRTLKELPPRSGHDWLSTLEREAILGGRYWGLTQKRICTLGASGDQAPARPCGAVLDAHRERKCNDDHTILG